MSHTQPTHEQRNTHTRQTHATHLARARSHQPPPPEAALVENSDAHALIHFLPTSRAALLGARAPKET